MIFKKDQFFKKQAINALSNLEYGSLKLTTPDGDTNFFQGKQAGINATMVVHDWSVAKNALLKGDIGLGEDYIAGLWDTDSVENLFTVFLQNMHAVEEHYAHGKWWHRLGFVVYDRLLRRNSKKGSQKNISEHYDVGNDFYKLWLDDTMTYSSALYHETNVTLEQAQKAKYQRIFDRAASENASILEIGCGWGGFAESATNNKAHVTGVTISRAQHQFAKQRMGETADIRLQDYRDVKGLFDAIVSIEMFEAVGERYWPEYFKTVADRLKKGGKAMIQTITIGDNAFAGYRRRSDFLRRYVFPGGMLPSPKKFTEAANNAGLVATDTYTFGQDYAKTLREWLIRFEEKRSEIMAMGYNEAFIRNWRFYLGICAAAFASGHTNVMQVELQHN